MMRINLFELVKKLVCSIMFVSLFVVKGQVITSICGTGTLGYSGDGGSAMSAQLSAIWGQVCCDKFGNIFIADKNNSVVRKITKTTGIISTVAGNGTSGFGGDGGAATSATLSQPTGVAVDQTGNIYIVDQNNNRIRMVNTLGIISTICGNGTGSSTGDGGLATAATINTPYQICVDKTGNIYFTESLGCRIRKIDITGHISSFCGNGTATSTGDGGSASLATVYYPNAIAVDTSSNIYFATNQYIRKVTVSTGIVSAFAGTSGMFGFSGDGAIATSAKFNGVAGIAVNRIGEVYISDAGNFRVRKVSVTDTITTYAGTTNGFSGDGGNPTAAKTSTLGGLAIYGCNLYLNDWGNARLRMIVAGSSPTLAVNSGSICTGKSFTIVATGATYYTIQGGNAIVSPTANASYTVTGMSNLGCLAISTVTSNVFVNFNPTLTANGATSVLCSGQTATLTAGGATTYTWSNSATTTSIIVSPNTTTSYTVSGTDANGCVGATAITQNVSNCTGIQINAGVSNSIKLFPNPAINFVNINSDLEFSSIELVDVTGRSVFKEKINASSISLNLLNINSGVYFVKLMGDNSILLANQKFIISK